MESQSGLSVPARPLLFRTIRAGPRLDPTRISRAIRNAPRREEDYISTDLAAILQSDLRKATVILEPSLLCDLRCSFCALPVTSKTRIDWERLRPVIQALRLAGVSEMVLTGGEPGIHPKLGLIVSEAVKWGFSITLLTHGMWVLQSRHLKEVLGRGLKRVVMSIKALDEVTSREITNRASVYERQKKAITIFSRACLEQQLSKLTLNFVITRNNVFQLRALGELANELPYKPELRLSLMEPYTESAVEELPNPAMLREALEQAFSFYEQADVVCYIEGVPLCWLGQYWKRSLDIGRRKDTAARLFISPRPEADYLFFYRGYQRMLQFFQPPPCSPCSRRTDCPGLHTRVNFPDAVTSVNPFQ